MDFEPGLQGLVGGEMTGMEGRENRSQEESRPVMTIPGKTQSLASRLGSDLRPLVPGYRCDFQSLMLWGAPGSFWTVRGQGYNGGLLSGWA